MGGTSSFMMMYHGFLDNGQARVIVFDYLPPELHFQQLNQAALANRDLWKRMFWTSTYSCSTEWSNCSHFLYFFGGVSCRTSAKSDFSMRFGLIIPCFERLLGFVLDPPSLMDSGNLKLNYDKFFKRKWASHLAPCNFSFWSWKTDILMGFHKFEAISHGFSSSGSVVSAI